MCSLLNVFSVEFILCTMTWNAIAKARWKEVIAHSYTKFHTLTRALSLACIPHIESFECVFVCERVCVCAFVRERERARARARVSIPVLDPRNVPHTHRGGSGRKHKSGLTLSAPRQRLWPANRRSAEVSSLVQSVPVPSTPSSLFLYHSLSIALSRCSSPSLSPSLSLSFSL